MLAPSPRQVSLQQLDALLAVVPPGYPWVAVVVDPNQELMQALLDRKCPRVQFHGQESAEVCQRWSSFTGVMKALKVSRPEDLADCHLFAPVELLLDGPRPGQGQTFDWNWLLYDRPPQPFFLAGGLNPENVGQALEQVDPFGVDVSSGVESEPGKKDGKLLQAFVERVRSYSL